MLPRTESLYPNLLLHAAAADVTDGGRRPLSEGTVGRAEKEEEEELRGTKFGHISILSPLLCFSGSRRPSKTDQDVQTDFGSRRRTYPFSLLVLIQTADFSTVV